MTGSTEKKCVANMSQHNTVCACVCCGDIARVGRVPKPIINMIYVIYGDEVGTSTFSFPLHSTKQTDIMIFGWFCCHGSCSSSIIGKNIVALSDEAKCFAHFDLRFSSDVHILFAFVSFYLSYIT